MTKELDADALQRAADLFFDYLEKPARKGEDITTINALRKEWKLIGKENGGNIYRTPGGTFRESLDKHGYRRLTRIFSLEEEISGGNKHMKV